MMISHRTRENSEGKNYQELNWPLSFQSLVDNNSKNSFSWIIPKLFGKIIKMNIQLIFGNVQGTNRLIVQS